MLGLQKFTQLCQEEKFSWGPNTKIIDTHRIFSLILAYLESSLQ